MKVSRIVVQAKWFLGIFSFCPDYADNEENDRFFSARQVQLSQQLDFIGDKGNEERERERERRVSWECIVETLAPMLAIV